MPRSLSAGRKKLTILTTEPADPANPTITELAAGLHASPRIVASDFVFGATDSDTIAERAQSEESNANALSASNYQFGMSVWRYFTEEGASDAAGGDNIYQAVKVKGTEVWVYMRNTSKKSDEPWAEDDEISLGALVQLDQSQEPSDEAGYIKKRIPGQVQQAWPDGVVAAGA